MRPHPSKCPPRRRRMRHALSGATDTIPTCDRRLKEGTALSKGAILIRILLDGCWSDLIADLRSTAIHSDPPSHPASEIGPTASPCRPMPLQL
jgi:hypothetical protein